MRRVLVPLQLTGALIVWGLFLVTIAVVLGLLVGYWLVTGVRV